MGVGENREKMRRGERSKGENEGEEGGGSRRAGKRERGEQGSHTEHLIHGLCSALAAGKECFKLNCKKLPYWKQIGLWSRWTGSSPYFS